jgi:hypothetical protein
MSFLNSKKSSSYSYSLSMSSSSSASSELDVDQSSSSTKEVFILPKPDTLVWATEQSGFPRLTDFTFPFWTLDCPSWSWSKYVDDDEIFSRALDDDFLLLIEPYICSSTFRMRFALSGQPYYILISSFISALKALDKSLDAWASRYRHFFYACVWGQSSQAYERPTSTIDQTWGFYDIWDFYDTKLLPWKWGTSTEGTVIQGNDIIISPSG